MKAANDMIVFAGKKASENRSLSSSLTVAFFFLLLLWQQNSPTDHNPREREFNAATGNFMALPSAVLRITGVLLEVVLENERKNKVCAKYLNETGSYCSP